MIVMTICLLGGALIMGLAGGLVFVLAARSGHFEDLEEVKYQIMREDPSDEHINP
jgi:cbb3-type cytochrome oxidase maturation protein